MNPINIDFNHLVIIGNGFDLNLGLKTIYTDYIYSTHFQALQASGNQLSHILQQKHSLKNWIDVENELKSISKE